MAKAEKVLSAEELEVAIAHEREPAKRRAERLKDLSEALLAGPEPEHRSKITEEISALKEQRHARSPKLAELLGLRRAQRRDSEAQLEESYTSALSFEGKSDERLAVMLAEQRQALSVARAVLGAIGEEMDRRQSRAANSLKLDKLSPAELQALAEDIKERQGRLDG